MQEGYNERLFRSSPIRRFYHTARFNWVRDQLNKHPVENLRIFELGCFDGKLLDFLPRPPVRYVGLDANWEGGVDIARTRFGGRTDVEFIEASNPTALGKFPDKEFNCTVALETLEHIPPAMLTDYLRQVARITQGRLLVSVPNEMGPVFAAKWLAKKVRYGDAEKYTMSEFLAATAYRSDKVQRDQHKGFDYRRLVDEIAAYFDVRSVVGIPAVGLPPALSLTVGIVAHSRPRSALP